MRSFLDFALPWRRPGIRPHDAVHALITLALGAALIAVGFGAGYHTAQRRYTAAYFRVHYANLGLALPRLPSAGPVIRAPLPSALPATVSLVEAAVEPVQDQGPDGACAGVSDAESIGYRVRLTNPKHRGMKVSGQYLYSGYIDKYSGGQDTGSDPVRDAAPVSTLGVPQLKYWSSGIRNPFPTATDGVPGDPAMFRNAAQWRLPVSVETRYYGPPRDAVFQEAVAALTEGQVAILGINVTPSFDAAWDTGRVWLPANPVESNRGAHAIVVWREPGVTMPDGSPALEARNSWGPYWGSHGDVLISEKWLAQNAFAVWELQGI